MLRVVGRKSWPVLLLLFGFAACETTEEGGSCGGDGDCKGDRICEDGECVSPGGSSTNQGGNGTGAAGGSAVVQPYGKCVASCTSSAECCSKVGCDFDTDYECVSGQCLSRCKASCGGITGGFELTCISGHPVSHVGDSFCGLFCGPQSQSTDTCSTSFGEEFSCQATGNADTCVYDCFGSDANCPGGSSGNTKCRPDSRCGCFGDGDCSPGYVCDLSWTVE
jgi:hypothetical protein